MTACKSLTRVFSRALMLAIGVAASQIAGNRLAVSQASSYPGRDIVRIVVPTPSGPPPDAIARVIATELSESEGWRVVVDNRPGALQLSAMTDVLKHPADGLSIFPMSLGAIPTPALVPEKGILLQTDFAPVVKIATGYTVLVVNPSLPAATLPELIALLKAHPDKFNYSSGGFGTPAHLLGEMVKLQTGTSFTVVQYPQNSQRVSDLLSGRTQFAFFNTPAAVDLIATGKLRALALAGPNRIPALKDVPTVVEAGFPNLAAGDWVGFVVKAGTPTESIARLNQAVNNSLTKDSVRDSLTRLGFEYAGGTPAEMGRLIVSQVGYWTKVVRESGIKLPQ
jgi:tripartite-type tricarboxylate transporter receptor subunit TctC